MAFALELNATLSNVLVYERKLCNQTIVRDVQAFVPLPLLMDSEGVSPLYQAQVVCPFPVVYALGMDFTTWTKSPTAHMRQFFNEAEKVQVDVKLPISIILNIVKTDRPLTISFSHIFFIFTGDLRNTIYIEDSDSKILLFSSAWSYH